MVVVDENELLSPEGEPVSFLNFFPTVMDVLNYSWDGEMYWFKKEDAKFFLEFAQQWFEENHENMSAEQGEGFSNCLLYAKTKTGMIFIDTQRDSDSQIDDLLKKFERNYPARNEYLHLDDCHLVDNLKFGRNNVENSDKILKFWIDEGLLNENVLFNANKEYFESYATDKIIVMLGDFPMNKNTLQDYLKYMGFQLSEEVTNKSWLWIGENPDLLQMDEAQKIGARISTLKEVVDIFYNSNKTVN